MGVSDRIHFRPPPRFPRCLDVLNDKKEWWTYFCNTQKRTICSGSALSQPPKTQSSVDYYHNSPVVHLFVTKFWFELVLKFSGPPYFSNHSAFKYLTFFLPHPFFQITALNKLFYPFSLLLLLYYQTFQGRVACTCRLYSNTWGNGEILIKSTSFQLYV